MFPREHRVPAQFEQENSEIRLERPDFAEGGALFALIEELLGQEQQADRFPLSIPAPPGIGRRERQLASWRTWAAGSRA
jgi:hypothetical protein